MKENNPLVKLENAGVYKSSKWLVKGISFEVNNGQIVTLIGPNGSGKTTTAKMILNILNADEVSSLLSVQEGCDKFCSFCVVPYTRGVEVSRTAKQIISEAKELISLGAKEIILLGQNVEVKLIH